jgi:hypothetical protein
VCIERYLEDQKNITSVSPTQNCTKSRKEQDNYLKNRQNSEGKSNRWLKTRALFYKVLFIQAIVLGGGGLKKTRNNSGLTCIKHDFGIEETNAGIGIPASVVSVRYRTKKMPDCLGVVQYRSSTGIVSFCISVPD